MYVCMYVCMYSQPQRNLYEFKFSSEIYINLHERTDKDIFG